MSGSDVSTAIFPGEFPTFECIVSEVEGLVGVPVVTKHSFLESSWPPKNQNPHWNGEIAFQCLPNRGIYLYFYKPIYCSWGEPCKRLDIFPSGEDALYEATCLAIESLGGQVQSPYRRQGQYRYPLDEKVMRETCRRRQILDILKFPFHLSFGLLFPIPAILVITCIFFTQGIFRILRCVYHFIQYLKE